ncbi:hypothetical protein PIB30_040514 [Stylosanthes scabra]|uniref:Pathogenesis-related homeodomain protein n=1 Tax=Stylosanthes scabra TaxID=79078 RepID=A0ABU6RES1_9FABA|nr:hypothetical protein [Stylosanthes scabra]
MRDSKKSKNRGLQKSIHSKAKTESKLNSSLRVKTKSTKCQGKKHKLKSKSHTQRKASNVSRKRATDASIKGPNKEPSKKKLIIRFSLHETDEKSSTKLSSKSKLKGEKVSFSSKKEGKNVDDEVKIQKRKRKRKKKRQRNNADIDDASRLKRRTRYLLIKMKLEQNLIDAYSGEGWKGQSREKIRPEKELQRAWKQILKCKLGIRDAIHQLDSLSSLNSSEDSVIATDESNCHEHKYCQKCKSQAIRDKDIIRCDGTCNRTFHKRCLDPTLTTENKHGWLCKFCGCKMEILGALNAHLGTHFSSHSTWQEEWPSDDSEDDDYDPERREDCHNINAEGSDDDLSSSTSLCSSDGECSLVDEGFNHEYSSLNGCIDSNESEENVCGPRQRKTVDYKQLYDEMFGKDAAACEQVSEDEDWDPIKRRRRDKESDAVDTLMTLHECQNRIHNSENNNMKREDSPGKQIKRSCFRIPREAVEKLRQVFAENELPPRSKKLALSKELGLNIEKVSKWFKNARYSALKSRKQHTEGSGPPQTSDSKDNRLQDSERAEVSKPKASKSIIDHSLKNCKAVNGRKKRRPEVSASQPENNNKDMEDELSDDVCLMKLLKDKKKKMNSAFEGYSHTAELEFERLSRVKDKLDNLRKKLTAILNYRENSSKASHSNEPSIMYVPTAVLREKVA